MSDLLILSFTFFTGFQFFKEKKKTNGNFKTLHNLTPTLTLKLCILCKSSFQNSVLNLVLYLCVPVAVAQGAFLLGEILCHPDSAPLLRNPAASL